MRQGIPFRSTRYRPLGCTLSGYAVRMPASVLGSADETGLGGSGPPGVTETLPTRSPADEATVDCPVSTEPLDLEQSGQLVSSTHPSSPAATGDRPNTGVLRLSPKGQ